MDYADGVNRQLTHRMTTLTRVQEEGDDGEEGESTQPEAREAAQAERLRAGTDNRLQDYQEQIDEKEEEIEELLAKVKLVTEQNDQA